MSSRPSHTPKVTVEDLLRLKRAERPDPEFWSKFEVELRQKQLAALVQRRPWWERLPLLVGRRAYLPLGATAAIAFTLVAVRLNNPAPVAPAAPEQPVRTSVAVAPTVSEPRHDIVASVQRNEPAPVAVATVEQPVEAAPAQLSEKMPAQTDTLIPWSVQQASDSPSARSMAANLARLEQTNPGLTQALLTGSRPTSSDSTLAEPVTQAVEFATVSAISSRRNRLLASMTDRQFVQDPTAPEVVRERLARRLGDTELAGGWTRVGLKADRVSLKF